ncbi:PLP-dependent aminotransferase family protein [Kutzneria sp. 744]|uniref:MocR-like pyridoxine biosynthesis transcription factor PdxR n=1 Tax=Kutzneria sp. (strain 744) TaxID=345341 RepID=UPI0003EEBC74|nr:PLP-dependent aminotransferase family protein [Kutzneria sp. 744]EWM16307.1 transcriptional regulator [Kutzneria sp. 744]
MPESDDALLITLDREARTPLAVQLADALRAAAAAGQLRAGDRLPSTRTMASHLKVSRTVTAAAYDQLLAEGWIVGKHGSGTYVTTAPPGSSPVPSDRPRTDAPSPDLISLELGRPWVGGLDRAAWRRAWRAAADNEPLVRHHPAGLPEYREAVAEHLLRHRGLTIRGGLATEAVLATGGTSAAVAELAVSVFQPGDTVAVEEPGYRRTVEALKAVGVQVLPAPLDRDGILVDQIPSGIRAVYCSPAHQYPLGSRLPAARRVALVERARREGWLIIEDDYDGELRYDVAPLPLLAALAPDVVVHLGTTSKILTPTLGAGWLVGPPEVAGTLLAYRERTGTGPAPAGQRVLVELARNGDLGRHLRRLRRELSERRVLVVETLRAAGIPVLGDDAGSHVVVLLPSIEKERSVVHQATRLGVRLDGLERHHTGPSRWHGVAIGYTACSRDQLISVLPPLIDLLTT